MAQLAVELPDDMVQAMQAHASERGVTVDALVAEAFRHVGNRVATEHIHVQ